MYVCLRRTVSLTVSKLHLNGHTDVRFLFSASEMTYIVSRWALNSTHSLTHLSVCLIVCRHTDKHQVTGSQGRQSRIYETAGSLEPRMMHFLLRLNKSTKLLKIMVTV